MRAAAQSQRTAIARAAMAAASVLAVAVAWLCIATNLEHWCSTQEATGSQLCPTRSSGTPTSADLRSHIAANPGDANAYVQLALANPTSPDAEALRAAAQLAPTDPGVLMLKASLAAQRQDWAGAVPPLVMLAEHRDLPQPPLVLARLIGAGQGALLAPHLTAGNRWFSRVLANMQQAQAPLGSALALVAQALKSGVLGAGDVRSYVRQLKASGDWVDAYSLWLALHAKPLPAIYNASFEEAFQPDGFDWEVSAPRPLAKAGAIVQRRGGSDRHGATLDVRFTGRMMAMPLARQYVFLAEGHYRLRGDYLAQQLRTDQGFVWALQCTASKTRAGQSPALEDTGGTWRRFEFEFTVPPGCGAVSRLQLETSEPANVALGASGHMAFDAFALEWLPP